MIEQITDLQFKRVCMFINEHRDLMKKLFNIKVNLSSLDLMRSDCSSHFIRMMDDMDIHHDWIQFEITETVATEYNAGLGMVIDGVMAAGVRLCLDDFGSGYANLNTVMRLPFSAIRRSYGSSPWSPELVSIAPPCVRTILGFSLIKVSRSLRIVISVTSKVRLS